MKIVRNAVACMILTLTLVLPAFASPSNEWVQPFVEHQAGLIVPLRFQEVKVMFLSVASGDPSPSLMKALRTSGRDVRVASHSRIDASGNIVDTKTGERGVLVFVQEARPVEERVEVTGGFYERRDVMASYTYHLAQKGGRWVVEDVRIVASEEMPPALLAIPAEF